MRMDRTPRARQSGSTNERGYSVYLVDDHPVVCRGLTAMIEQEEDLGVCGHAESAEQGLEDILALQPDVVLVDLSLKGMGGIELIKTLKVRLPDLPILVVSMHDEGIYAERVIRAGAKGYIMKDEAVENLLAALRRVLEGKIYVSNGIKDRILEGMWDGTRPDRSPVSTLSDRELQVLELIGQGLRTKEIASRLHLAVKTIEAYRAHIKEKLGLKDYMALVKYAIMYVAENKSE